MTTNNHLILSTPTPLTTTSDIQDFDCGDEDLNDFLKNDALTNQEAWLSATKLLYRNNKLLGFFTVTSDTLHKERIAESD